MAAVKKAPVSSIAMALAGKTSSVNIPKPAGNDEAGSKKKKNLPTPPNSISPTLPPQIRVERDPLTPPGQASDSDIDLQEAVEHAQAQGGGFDKNAIDATGNITPTLLATYHLPGILLEQGELAIRHIMAILAIDVPGFAGIEPNKARRVVVAALEGRGGQHEASGGLNGEVIFEKVGWGKWKARYRGQPASKSRHTSPVATRHANNLRSPSPYSTSHPRSPLGTSHPKSFRLAHRPRDKVRSARSFNRRHETDADKMSLDSGSAGDSFEEEHPYLDDLDDETDEEDWASIGAAALRAGFSFPKNQARTFDYNARSRQASAQFLSARKSVASASVAKSVPALTEEQMKLMQGVGKDEGEAVQALLQLGSM